MSGSLAYITQHKRTDHLSSAERHEFGVLGFPGLSIVHVEHEGGITEETIALEGIKYMSLDEAAAAWREQRQRRALHDAVGRALRQLFFGSEETQDWSTLPDRKRDTWIEGARSLVGHLKDVGLQITPTGD